MEDMINGIRTDQEKKLSDKSCSYWLECADEGELESLESRLELGSFSIKVTPQRHPTVPYGFIDYNGSYYYHLGWSEKRGEWLAANTGPELDSYMYSPNYIECYSGPFALDDLAKRKLLEIYSLTEEDVPLDRAAKTSPKEFMEIRSGRGE